MASLAHPNIVTFYGVVEEKVGGCPGTVQQYMQGGSLRKALSRIKRRCADGKGCVLLSLRLGLVDKDGEIVGVVLFLPPHRGMDKLAC